MLVTGQAHDAFVERLVARARAMVVGDPLDPKTEMGAAGQRQQLETILGYIESGKRAGATVPAGGERDREGAKASGNFLKPTVFTDVQPRMQHRPGGDLRPGALGAPLRRRGGGARRWPTARATGWRPASGPRDVARAHALARKVQAGVVWINCFNEFDDAAPFGGYKESGWGRDLSAPRAGATTRS